jgi:hypothetical protein
MIEDQHQPYDKSSKWLIQHHGDSMLRLARVEKIEAWRPAQAEVVQPRQLPDGLLEVRLRGEPRDDLFLLEVATYPERRVGKQLTGDLMLVYLDRGELPEAVTLVLRPKGKYRIPTSRNLCSRHGLSSCRLKWRVVELWTIPAEDLLQAHDVGLIPWVPLTDFADPPETMMQRCREAIEQHAPPGEKANLLAVTQVLTYLRYNDAGLLTIVNMRGHSRSGSRRRTCTGRDDPRVQISFRPYTPYFQNCPRSALIAAGVDGPHIRNVTRQPQSPDDAAPAVSLRPILPTPKTP